MKIKTHYDNLKVARDASPDEIKRAFRKLTFQHHPDRCPPDQKALQERRMRIIKEAYNVLSDPLKRATHDAWIAQQEKSTQQEQQQKHHHSEHQQHYQGNQENYYRELYREQHTLNMKLQETIKELARKNNALTKIAKEHIAKCEELTEDNNDLKAFAQRVSNAYSEAQEKIGERKTNNRIVAFVLICILGVIAWRVSQDYSANVKAVLGENLLTKSDMPKPFWKVSDWYRDEMVLTRITKRRYEFLRIVNTGNVTKKMIQEGVRGSFKGLGECDTTDPNSAISKGKVGRYRFVLLEKGTVVSVTLPFSQLCQ